MNHDAILGNERPHLPASPHGEVTGLLASLDIVLGELPC